MIVDLVLAAGLGTRVGGTKALLDLGGAPLLTRVLDAVLASQVSMAIVVVGSDADRVLPLTRRSRVAAILNPAFREAQVFSLQAALRVLPAEARAFLIHPVDYCLVRADHIDALLAAFETAPPSSILRPRHHERFGHPVLYPASYAAEFLALAPAESARDVYRRHLDRVIAVDVSDAACTFDLDTPEDLEYARAQVAMHG